MKIVKQSFLSNFINRDLYHDLMGLAKLIAVIGTVIVAILFGLTFICHSSIVCELFSWVSGTSLLFIIYIVAVVLVLDVTVDVEEPESRFEECPPKPGKYKLTIVWGVILVLLGVAAIYFSNKYRKQYTFECETFLVDNQAGIYHLNWDNHCEVADEAYDLVKMQGYQIDTSYTFCDWCEEWMEDAEDTYESNRYFRR